MDVCRRSVRLAERSPSQTELYPVRVGEDAARTGTMEVALVPYYRWGNRGPGGMRIWLPTI